MLVDVTVSRVALMLSACRFQTCLPYALFHMSLWILLLTVGWAQSGLFYLLSGLETPSRAALKAAGKGFIKIDKTKEYINKLHEYNIAVDSAMLFGFDEHSSDIFEETLAFVEDIELDVCHAVIITPYPGTALYQQLEDEQRLLTKDWSLYDGTHAVFQPKQMTPQELEEGHAWSYEKYNSLGRRFKRRFVKARNIGWINSGYF